MTPNQPPLVLCTENAAGEEVSINIEPEDDFHSFLVKANSLLGYEVDLNSVTRNQPVALTDNIYQFFINSETPSEYHKRSQTFDGTLEPNGGSGDQEYVLDDGTQIKASQIHFDNDDAPFDFIAEKIPFVKYAEDGNDEVEAIDDANLKLINIVASPISKWSNNSSPKKPFINSLPFRLVNNNTSGFAGQFVKYLEGNADNTFPPNPIITKNKSPRILIRDNYKKYEDVYNKNDKYMTRDEVLNLFKDTPVMPYETNYSFNEKRRHVRKSDPSRPIHKTTNTKLMPYVDDDGTIINIVSNTGNQNCFICEKFVDNNSERLYLFDNEDQMIHKSSPQKKLSTQLKIICEVCLSNNFKPSRMKSPSKNLNPDEYLVIKNNQQYIFQKTNSIDFKNIRSSFVNIGEATAIIDKIETEILKCNEVKQMDFVKVEIGSDGEIKTKDEANIEDEDSSDVEIVEPEIDDVIDNLEEADEEVKEFLGVYQCDTAIIDLKCRFCELVFADLPELMDHGDIHKHITEDGEVFPCPLCNYGYANLKWLKGHLKVAHEKQLTPQAEKNTDNAKTDSPEKPQLSPVAKRTRSNDKKKSDEQKDTNDSAKTNDTQVEKSGETEKAEQESTLEFKCEVKQEVLDTSDEEAIWIVHTADDVATDQLHTLLHGSDKNDDAVLKKPQKCSHCSQPMADASAHKCRKRGRKRKSLGSENATYVPKLQRPRKKRTTELTSDPQIVTCHNCNESYTSKVRLKFHMQFHDTTDMLNSDGKYTCPECPATTFATETELFDHVHFQHDKENRYQCPVKDCGKTFFLRASLTKHSRMHTDTRRYVCVTCGKRFLDKQTLDEHGVTHLQIKPFQCHICLKQLTRRSRLRMHMRAHEEALCPALVPVCAACRRAFQDLPAAVEHVKKSSECLEMFATDIKEDEPSIAVLSPTSGLVRATQKDLSLRIEREARCSGAATLLAPLPPDLRRAVRCVKVEKAFRCEYCEDVFYLEEDLNNHRAIHKGIKNPFTCHICKVSFATYSRCTTHKTTHGFYKRPLADAKKNQPSGGDTGPSARGILGYGGFPVVKHFLCEDCGRSYLHWTYLQVHRRMKHANENFVYQCNQCSEIFPNSWSVAYHRKKVHGKSGLDKGNGVTKTVINNYRIPCRDCDEILPNKTALYKHRKKEHSYVSVPVDDKQVHACHVCAVIFATRTELDMHTRTHTSYAAETPVHSQDPQYHCDECPSHFFSLAELAQHSRNHTERPFACEVCGHAFRSASVLAEHTRIHTGERPFPCDVCGVAFRRATAMRNHRLIHTGVRAWGCTRCPKRFRIRSDLNTHARLKHPMHLAVLEMQGLSPTPEEIMQSLTANNITHENVIEITKISFPKGVTSVIPDSYRALSMLSCVPRTEVAWNCPPIQSDQEPGSLYSARRGRGIARGTRTRRLSIMRSPTAQSEDLTGLDVRMLLQDSSQNQHLLEQSALNTGPPTLDSMLLLGTPQQ